MSQFKKYSIIVDNNMDIISAGEIFLEYIGRTELRNLDQVVPPQDLIQLRNAVFAIDPGVLGLTCFRIRTASGKLSWIASNIKKPVGKDSVINMELSDIQTLKSDETAAHLDSMTGIMNKHTITEYAEGLTKMRPKKSFYFCLMDIDHFKSVNDTFGHMKGDEVIIDVAHIINECVGGNGFVGRIGGDEFMLVLEKVDNKPKAREVLSSIRESVETKYKELVDGPHITVSIGAAFYPDYAGNYDALFKLTDKMLYLAKMKGRNRYIIYTPEIHGDVNERQGVEPEKKKREASPSEKLRMMMDFMANFMHSTDIPIRIAIEKVLTAYDLDELYIYYDDLGNNRYGIERVDLGDQNFMIENKNQDMAILGQEYFQKMFDSNQVAIVNLFDLNREKNPELFEYMEKSGRRYMVVYHMIDYRKKGYVVFANKRDSSRRLSDADVLDLIYFARMIEITSSDR